MMKIVKDVGKNHALANLCNYSLNPVEEHDNLSWKLDGGGFLIYTGAKSRATASWFPKLTRFYLDRLFQLV